MSHGKHLWMYCLFKILQSSCITKPRYIIYILITDGVNLNQIFMMKNGCTFNKPITSLSTCHLECITLDGSLLKSDDV